MSAPRQARPPASYVHGVAGPVVIVPGRVAAWLNRHGGLDELRRQVRGGDPEVDSALIALKVAGDAWLTSVTSRRGIDDAQSGEPVASSPWLTTRQVADQLGLTVRGVRVAIESGRLRADRDTAGRWVVSRESFEHYRASRRAA
ncbi:helix-turn-helix domain-containing protein [Geodermatophilus marinus]|uniref:helix-turn-helix domain-containing protein n=1 Tax=Geodermatophilus sp. LHW52908 TaxID=2303986 RepID=UPI000E3ECD80|nr:helix-turn-helix domain-containing protein [Geodermatophilus sp. LHW52908]RFU18827.1 DNA-binding protein [Geodermatophilus sp. LHW52908]